ncbi:MAG: fibrobacter succinogenes major paralogous domain-containing protein [Prevotella sp.]|jgi:uncharacterized protein (TIGR02145 family)|nr:fibrobacter succinogenes major paralogous domain-containing protein [Prevotella sp.]
MNKLTLLYLFLPLLAFIGLHGQVTIGADKTPVGGAILDLKQKDAADGGVTSALGMMLPRVNLINLQPITATGANSLPVSIGAAASENWDLSAHTGLTVYNVKESGQCDAVLIPRGVYTWTGTEWRQLGQGTKALSPDVHEFTDPRDGEKYLYRTFGTAGEWMLENLRYIPNATDGYPDYTETAENAPDPTAKYYTFVGPNGIYDPSTAKTTWESGYKHYGIRYNFHATINVGDGSGITVTNPTTNEGESSTQPIRRGVCPPGWHVPNVNEWKQLRAEIMAYTQKYADETSNADDYTIGRAMSNACEPGRNGAGRYGTSKPKELGGFDLLHAGSAVNGASSDLYYLGYIQTACNQQTHSGMTLDRAWYAEQGPGYGHLGFISWYKFVQRTVRCKKDAP